MSQPPFQPPPQPPQPPHSPQNQPNPYSRPAPPQQAPGFGPPSAPGQPPMQAGPPPVPGQPQMYSGPQPVPQGQPPVQPMYPMQPTPPFQAPPFGQRPNASGNAVGAVFLGLLVSFIVSLVFSGLIVVIGEDLTFGTSTALYLAHALLNGALVGTLIGKVGHRSNGARICGAVIAALGAFFGWANSLPMYIVKEKGYFGIKNMLEYDPFLPAKAWWNDESTGGVDWTSPLGLVLAAAAAWGIAYLIGNKRRQA